MIINHNMNALNAHRSMVGNTATAGKSMEKLSSGLRINRAGDDAAGLAISEKMRGQIRGLDQAQRNSQDGISLIQTAEGALNETHSILQRMRELAVQSSTDTNNAEDRAAIQKEVEQLTSEIERIGNTTEFNTTKLIDGSIGANKVAGTDNASVISDSLGKETSAKLNGNAALPADVNSLVAGKNTIYVDGAKIEFNLDAERVNEYKAAKDAAGTGLDADKVSALLKEDINNAIDKYNKENDAEIAKVDVSQKAGTLSISSGSEGATSSIKIDKGADSTIFGATKLTEVADGAEAVGSEGVFDAAGAANVAAAQGLTGDSAKMTFTVDGKEISIDLSATGTNAFTAATKAVASDDMNTLATALQTDLKAAIDAYNKTVPTSEQVSSDIKVSVKDGAFVVESGSDKATSSIKFDDSEAAKLLGLAKKSSSTQGGGVDFQIGANQGQSMKITIGDMRSEALGIDKIDMTKKEGAQEATTVLDNAIKTVSSQRAELGAYQNRLEHTINNLGTSSENLTAAESRVRDVDMAKEMMTFSKNNILQQAAQAMLAQANQQPQGVLQLLR